MARIIGGSMIGELSGKLGGNVFARNKSGQYIRSYAIPVDPRSQAQVDARAAFGTASSSYHRLSSTDKARWNEFAINNYNPKNNTNTGQFSGFNAFTALTNVVVNANRLQVITPEYANNLGPILLPELNNFEISTAPPIAKIQANLMNKTGSIIPIFVAPETSINEIGVVTVVLNLNSAILPTVASIEMPFQDGAGNEIGFAVYMSNSVNQPGMFFSNPEQYLLGYVPGLVASTPSIGPSSTIEFKVDAINANKYQTWPSIGEIVQLTVYAVSKNGQMIKIGSITTEIQ